MGVSGYIFPSCAPLPAPPLFSDPVKIYAKRRPKHFYRKKESYVLQCLRNFDIMDKKEEKKDHSRRSIYGGSTVEKIADATGDWRVKKVKGRFWFVDPEGYPFYCMGLCSVRYGKSYGGRQRVQDMFGTLDHWGKKTNGLVSGLGVNCVGPWSAHDVLNKSDERLPYMMMIPFAARFGKELNITKWGGGHVNFDGDVLPIFYPDFPGFAEKLAQYMVSECKSRDDRYCIGYFSDNELPFKQSALNKYIRLEDQNPGKIEALRWMSERGYTPDQATEEKVQIEFLGHVARTYFRICQRALKKAAPGKLYVGCRFHGQAKRHRVLFEAAGEFCDVISINWYDTWDPREKREWMHMWAEASKRPFIITEFYAKGEDTKMPNRQGAGWIVQTQRDRGLFFQNFVLALMEQPKCVGFHWFKYMDDDPDIKKQKQYGSNKGILDYNFNEYVDMIEEFKKITLNGYRLVGFLDASEQRRRCSMDHAQRSLL